MKRSHLKWYFVTSWLGVIALAVLMLTGFQQGSQSASIDRVALNNVSTTGPSNVLPNIGQAAHWLRYCTDTNATGIAIELEGSNDGTTWSAISSQGVDVGCNILEAGGYYPQVRVNLVTLNGAGAHVTAWYSASAFPIPGNGLSAANKPNMRTIAVPAITFRNNSQLSTASTVTATPGILYGGFCSNPNASGVWLMVMDAGQNISTATYGFVCPPNNSTPFSVPPQGISFSQSMSVACSTNFTTAVDPGSACVVFLDYKPLPTNAVPSNINAAGAVIASQPGTVTGDAATSTRGTKWVSATQ